MKTKFFFILLTAAMIFTSCESDLCKQTISYTKATAIYQDTDQLRNTPLNAATREIENAGKIYVAGDYLLIGEEGKGIHVIDNSNVSSPTLVNFLDIPMNREFIVDGNTLYAESHYDMLQIDISDLNNAKLESRATEYITPRHTNADGEHLVGFTYEDVTETLPCDSPINSDVINYLAWDNELIPPSTVPSSFAGSSSGTDGTLNKIALASDHLYIISDDDLHVFDASSGLTKVKSDINFSDGMETIIIRENEAFFGKFDGIDVADISNPASPVITREYVHEEACDPVLPYGDVAYVTLRVDGPCQGRQNLLDVVGLTGNGRFLSAIERINMSSPYGMTIVDKTLYVGEGQNGLKMFDVTNERSPQLIEFNQDVEAYDVILHPTKDLILLAGPDGLNIYENNSTTSLTYLSRIAY